MCMNGWMKEESQHHRRRRLLSIATLNFSIGTKALQNDRGGIECMIKIHNESCTSSKFYVCKDVRVCVREKEVSLKNELRRFLCV